MEGLTSFAPNPTALVVGASGGIGAAFVRHLQGAGAQVIEASRNGPVRIDYDAPETIPAALTEIEALDIVLVATGLLHEDEAGPEKSMRALDMDWMLRNHRVNAAGPLLVAAHALPKLKRDAKTCLAALSARVGSISDNRLGGWHSYRMAKAALNMGLRNLAIEHARRWPDSVVCGLHPGTVDTDLSKPFQRGVPTLLSPDESARRLLDVIDGLTPTDTGGVFAHDGERIPA